MSRDATRARAMLDAWRASGADRLDPVRFHRIDALERRAAGHDGDARRLLDARLDALLAGYADDVERAGDANEPRDVAQARPASGALAGLVTHIARDAQADRAGIDPALIDYFRETWSKVRTEKQYRQALDQVPRNAGPLNSSSLVHRSLSLMRDLSPGYLQQFLSYVDALAWLEDLAGGGAQAEKEAPRAKGVKKGARSKAR
ncbi:DUF2894 domain-containing protein [Burkholderia ubonensis]|uniref:DUF2894 domain-containing protein n=1 Tax=Burkholderia ubonensis TaxID=101571 RepID=UPI00075286BC|nr:DUF2894 domain-containing protein [Burkholderia ubonensis]KVP65901.1 hypothetical protein WJ90_22490 [Burkholderia ubonensis]KVR49069.1 hypothetical protein WK16_05070 [Burkholderia ubonensis]KVT01513.1 hypothetical protein WK46_18335 [Burkholderia ubonensis]KVT15977.1 hypothetical protein WK47_30685 [Burkholderia ubonensis]KVT32211.1 hypothetical protein WK50_07185 [Burkholderia ubonensis]